MSRVEKWLLESRHTASRPVAERVVELMEGVRRGSERREGESWDEANERHAEEFIAWLRAEFRGRLFEISWPPPHDQPERILLQSLADQERARGVPPAPECDLQKAIVLVERQKLKPLARRTTAFNYVFTVPGDRLERIVLVAHYDTWRGPGADDNTTGEEIVKQYLVEDLRAPARPALTHTYILAGSEECGLIGFTSQVVLALGLGLANVALAQGLFAVTALGLAITPLAYFRFGVSGSREYVQSLSAYEMGLVQSVISVDSVGEGRMYIPENSLGANFVRAFMPFAGYEKLNDLLEEAAHLHGIKYNNFIAGGTTDHVSFLEVNSSLRDRVGDWLGCPRWLGCHKHGKRKIPAAALVALGPGKASPLVFGGKIHTPQDTSERVYAGPLAEALRILDYWFHLMQGGRRIAEPRDLDEYHYAQLYRARLKEGDRPRREEYWLALKDAIEPNRRNINGLYRVKVELKDGQARCARPQLLEWGVETQLRREVVDWLADRGSCERVAVRELEVQTPDGLLRFAACRGQPLRAIQAAAQHALGSLECFMGSNTFLTFFAAAFLLAKSAEALLAFGFRNSALFQELFFDWFWVTLPATIALQLWGVMWLIGKKIPTMIDNSYKHLNKADNLLSLRRVGKTRGRSAHSVSLPLRGEGQSGWGVNEDTEQTCHRLPLPLRGEGQGGGSMNSWPSVSCDASRLYPGQRPVVGFEA